MVDPAVEASLCFAGLSGVFLFPAGCIINLFSEHVMFLQTNK